MFIEFVSDGRAKLIAFFVKVKGLFLNLILRHPQMRPWGVAEWFTWGAVAAFLGASIFAGRMAAAMAEESSERDMVLVILGALLATTLSLVAFAIRQEATLRNQFEELLYAQVTETTSGHLGLQQNRGITIEMTVANQGMTTYRLPLYRLPTAALRAMCESPLLRHKARAKLLVKLWLTEEFNLHVERALEATQIVLSSTNPPPSLRMGVQELWNAVEQKRIQMLREEAPRDATPNPPQAG